MVSQVRDDKYIFIAAGALVLWVMRGQLIPAAANLVTDFSNAVTNNAGSTAFTYLNDGGLPDSVFKVFNNAISIDYYGNIFARNGDMVGYITDDKIIRDAVGHAKGQLSSSDAMQVSVMNGYDLPNYQSILAGKGGYG